MLVCRMFCSVRIEQKLRKCSYGFLLVQCSKVANVPISLHVQRGSRSSRQAPVLERSRRDRVLGRQAARANLRRSHWEQRGLLAAKHRRVQRDDSTEVLFMDHLVRNRSVLVLLFLGSQSLHRERCQEGTLAKAMALIVCKVS